MIKWLTVAVYAFVLKVEKKSRSRRELEKLSAAATGTLTSAAESDDRQKLIIPNEPSEERQPVEADESEATAGIVLPDFGMKSGNRFPCTACIQTHVYRYSICKWITVVAFL